MEDKTLNDESFREEEVTSQPHDDGEQTHSPTESESQEDEQVTLTRAELEERERAIRKEQDKRWKARLKEAGKDEEGDKESHKKEVSPDERYDRLELKTEGVKDQEQQDFVLDYARLKGLTVTEALSSKVVQAELREMKEEHKRTESIPSPSRRTSAPRAQDDVAYWAKKLQDKGESAPSAELRRKVRRHLAGK